VLSVHDEFITEAGMDRTSKELARLMATPPSWAPDLPLNAAGFEAPRYRKD
jgi:DNA polymerase